MILRRYSGPPTYFPGIRSKSMKINVDELGRHSFAKLEQSYGSDQTIIYALGIGLGQNPLDGSDLDYLIEGSGKVLQTFAATLASPSMWLRDPKFGINFARLVHGEQDMDFSAPLPPAARVTATPRISGIFDRGAGKGALVIVEREIADADSKVIYATARQTLLLRDDGGFGGAPPPTSVAPQPDGPADCEVVVDVSPRAALIYRLSGDRNPLHSDPEFARSAGVERPILHGLATYGMAGRALTRAFGAELSSLRCRFSGIVYPGDQIRFNFWRADSDVRFIASVGERVVLDRGLAVILPHPTTNLEHASRSDALVR